MRIALLVAIAVCFASGNANSTDPPKPPYDLDFVGQFVTGEYVLIGRKPESDATYTGRMIFTQQGKNLTFTRTVGSDAQHGPVELDTKAAESGRPVLRICFSVGDQSYGATYLWHSDLSNFARLTGYVYLLTGETKFPGLEALFPLVDYNRNVDE
jgi:hypothetical protein